MFALCMFTSCKHNKIVSLWPHVTVFLLLINCTCTQVENITWCQHEYLQPTNVVESLCSMKHTAVSRQSPGKSHLLDDNTRTSVHYQLYQVPPQNSPITQYLMTLKMMVCHTGGKIGWKAWSPCYGQWSAQTRVRSMINCTSISTQQGDLAKTALNNYFSPKKNAIVLLYQVLIRQKPKESMDRFYMKVREKMDALELTKMSPQQIEELLIVAVLVVFS